MKLLILFVFLMGIGICFSAQSSEKEIDTMTEVICAWIAKNSKPNFSGDTTLVYETKEKRDAKGIVRAQHHIQLKFYSSCLSAPKTATFYFEDSVSGWSIYEGSMRSSIHLSNAVNNSSEFSFSDYKSSNSGQPGVRFHSQLATQLLDAKTDEMGRLKILINLNGQLITQSAGLPNYGINHNMVLSLDPGAKRFSLSGKNIESDISKIPDADAQRLFNWLFFPGYAGQLIR